MKRLSKKVTVTESDARQALISFIKPYVPLSEIPDVDLDELVEWCQAEDLGSTLEQFGEYCEEFGFTM